MKMEIIQHYDPAMPYAYIECMNQLRSKLPEGVAYKILNEKSEIQINSRKDSSLKRLLILRENPQGFWVDSDMTMSKWFDFEFEKNFVYVFGEVCSASAIYANGCADTINFLIENYDGRCSHILMALHKEKFKKIPNGYLKHLRLGTKRKMINN